MKSKEKVEIELLKEMTYTEINNLLISRNKQISYLQNKNEELVKKFSISSVGSSYHLNSKEYSKFKELDSTELRMYDGNGIGVKTVCVVDNELIDITDY